MYQVRNLELDDYEKKYVQLLARLSETPHVENEKELFEIFVNRLNDMHIVVVIEDRDKIIATGTCLIENKIIHGFSKVAHIEDIVVSEEYGGKGLGKKIIEYLTDYAEKNGCYKAILDCSNHNVIFYEKCGYELKGVQMARYF